MEHNKPTSPNAHSDADQLLTLLDTNQGYLTTRDLSAIGLPRVAITRLIKGGLIERIQRGVYRLSDMGAFPPADAEAEEFLELQLRYPYARPCLVSALHLHGLTTTRPAALQLAIPQNRRSLTVSTPATQVFYFAPKQYDAGVTTLPIRAHQLELYSPEKTLCDLLRYAPKFGRELYLEGLKKYLRSNSTHTLIAMAKRVGAWKNMERDLEVLAHDQDR